MNPVNFQWTKIAATAAGTSLLISAREGVLNKVVIPANKTGTADFYDAASAAGTSATTLMYSIPNTVGTIPTVLDLGHSVKKGLVVVYGGTVDFTVIYA